MKSKRFALKKMPLAVAAYGVVLAGGITAPVMAQDGAGLALEEVIVSARKRDESLQNSPVSAAVFDASALEAGRITDMSEIIGRVPGFVMNNDNITEPNIFMRGIGTDIESAASNSSIGMFVNEVYMPRAMAFSMDLFDMERVEVVRGPQGILYGKNVTGGVVNFITKKPTQDTEVSLSATAGSDSLKEFEGVLNGALSDTVSGRLSVARRDRDGFAKNTYTGNDVEDKESTSVRGQLLIEASENLEILLSADSSSQEGTGQWIHMLTPSAHNVPFQNKNIRKGPNNIDGKADADVSGADMRITWAGDTGTLTSITAVRKGEFEYLSNDAGSFIPFDDLPYDSDGNIDLVDLHFIGSTGIMASDLNDDYFVNHKEEDVDAFSQEIRWSSNNDGDFNYMVGAYYLKEEIKRTEEQTYFFVNFWNQGYEDATTESDNTTLGVFAELSYDVSEDVNFVFGLRYTDDDKDFEGKRGNMGNFLGADFTDEDGNTITSFNYKSSDSWSSVDPSLTVNWQVNDEVFVYATASTGFKSGGWNGENATTAAEAAAPYEEEEAVNYELGIKSELLDNRLRLNATAFFTTYDDLQTQQFVVFDVNLPADNIIANAGEAEVKGLEVEFTALLNEWWTISGNLASQDGEITGDLISTTLGYNPACDCSNIRTDTNLKGNDLRRTPETSWSIVNDFSWDMADAGSVNAMIQYSSTDGYHFDNENNPRTKNDDYQVWNASVNWMSADNQWEVSLWGKNLGDEDYFAGKVDVIGSVLASYGAPRTAGVTVKWNML